MPRPSTPCPRPRPSSPTPATPHPHHAHHATPDHTHHATPPPPPWHAPPRHAAEAPASPQHAWLLHIRSRNAGPSLPPSLASSCRAELNRAWWVLPFTLGGEEQTMRRKE
ncbi:unnamed protein product [Rangifer tarandus platyrhynchus]|uniref:Uncharacterized protein n=2 Tax=Rangifer tarandus platyrhynchus TaxID=3082113 RepID=A0ABN8Z1M7_RANTA|nr:unnamed protein product [Rangifer tarandus platyrhynchus]CAI9705508.1 unnamed protein product [Rangifer tarandus platyrhynchus]